MLNNISASVKLLGSILVVGTIIIGFIIWLAQLNWYALQSTTKNAQQDQIQQEILAKQVKVTQNVNKTALLLSILMDEMKELKLKVDNHQTEAEMWKEKIRQNERNGGS